MNELFSFGLPTFASFFTLINPLGTMPVFMLMTAELTTVDANYYSNRFAKINHCNPCGKYNIYE